MYTVFPFGSFGASGWAQAFKNMMASKQFALDFMYGAADGNCARVVFALRHHRNPEISPHGVGTMIQQLFPHVHGKGFAPVLTLDEATLVVVIGHIARYRNSTEPHNDAFNASNPVSGDVGNCLASTVVEWVRFTSCRPMLDGLQHDLTNSALREHVRSWNMGVCKFHQIPFQYDMEDPVFWNSRDKLADSVSAVFQVGEGFQIEGVAAKL